jgi:hypothetical protein
VSWPDVGSDGAEPVYVGRIGLTDGAGVLVDPEVFGTAIEGAVDRYVAMTRATGQLVILRVGHPKQKAVSHRTRRK